MINNTVKTSIFSAIFVIALFLIIPAKTYAVTFNPLNPIDPFCLFSCSDPAPTTQVTNSYNTGSYNVTNTVTTNPNPVVVTQTTPVYQSTPVYRETNNNYYSAPVSVPVYVPTTPVYTYSNYTPAPVYNYYTPNPVIVYNSYPLSISCRANTTFSGVGSYITWTAYVSGGYNNNYNYTWSGTDNIYGSGSFISTYYNTPGVKYAYVTVYSNGQTTSTQCSNTVTVATPVMYYNTYTNYTQSYNYGLQIACAADPISTRIGVPVTWTAEAIGNGYTSGFTYAWTGSDGLSGNQSSIITTYVTSGLKSAVVTVTSPNGQSQSKACANTVSVKGAQAYASKPIQRIASPPTIVTLPTPPAVPVSSVQAVSMFSLGNVPWGWVAVLVILVLLGMLFYLIFNSKKI